MTEGDGTIVRPLAIVLMGVSGSGKTTIGRELASQQHAIFADADDFHTEANKAKMRAGVPLTDEDRAPWLATLNGLLRGWAVAGTVGVLACSALKASYRDTLAAGTEAGAIAFVWLDGSKAMIAARLAARRGTYMNPLLLDSQFATLEEPREAVRVVNDRTPAEVAGEVAARLGLGSAAS